ncbi:glycosyltransferase family 39 protein [Candidatus Deianiraea vastatrix]|nr:glycosyltransferase family 39 protein [Candidatus Deianiraea vastatrix]
MEKILTNKNKSFFWLLLYILFWSLVPCILRNSLPLDTVEAISWGHEWQMSYNKHPPLSAWIAEIFFLAMGSFGLYFLSTLCITIALYFVKKTSDLLFFNSKNNIPYYLFLLSPVFSIYAVEFNVNILLIPLISASIYFYLLSITKNEAKYWILLAVFSTLCVLAKYTSILFIGIFFIHSIFYANAIKNWKFYLSGAIFLMLLTPHLIWLYNNDFITIKYAMARSVNTQNNRIYQALLTFCGEMFLLLPILPLLIVKRLKFNKEALSLNFVKFICVLPLFVFPLYALVTGNSTKTMWSIICCIFIGLIFQERKNIVNIIIILNIIYAGMYSLITAFRPFTRSDFDSEKFVEIVNSDAKLTYENDSKNIYVAGEIWLGSIINVYHKKRPSFFINANEEENAWFTLDKQNDFPKSAIIVVANSESEMNKFIKKVSKYKSISSVEIKDYNYCKVQEKDFVFKFKKCKPEKVLYTVL